MKRVSVKLFQIILIPVLVLGTVVALQVYFDREGFRQLEAGRKIKYSRIDDGVHLLPSPEGLRILANGYDTFLARFLMIQASNYFYQFKFSGRDNGYMNRMYTGITSLDRYYFLAYRYGGYFLSGPFKMQTDALRSLKRGVMELAQPDLRLSPFFLNSAGRKTKLLRMEYEPRIQASKLMLETAITYFAYLKDNISAAGVLKCAQFVFPEFKNDFFETELAIREEENQFHMVIAMWDNYIAANSTNEQAVALGKYKINLYTSLLRRDMYEKRASSVKKKTGAYPPTMVSFLRPGEVVDEFGDMYIYIPDTGKVYCRTQLRDEVEMKKSAYRRAVRIYKKKNGIFPSTLAQVKVSRRFDIAIEIPVSFGYNPLTGEVGLPAGFDDGIESVLLKTAAAAFIHAEKSGSFPGNGSPLDLLSSAGSELNRNQLETAGQYTIRFVPGGVPFGIIAEKHGEGAYAVSGEGIVRFKKDITGIQTWPSSFNEWEVAAF